MRNISRKDRRLNLEISSKVTKCALRDYRIVISEDVTSFSKVCWYRTIPKGRQDRHKRGSVSLCSLRSLRASMCQLFKIHKARGECQERTKFNDLHRTRDRTSNIGVNSSRMSQEWRVSRPISIRKGQYQRITRRHSLRFYFFVTLRNVNVT